MKRAHNSTTRSATKRAIRFIQKERRQAGQLFDTPTPPKLPEEDQDAAPVDSPDLPDM